MSDFMSLIIPAYNEADMISIAYSEIRQVLDECAGADADSKSGRIADTLAVELLIIRFSS